MPVNMEDAIDEAVVTEEPMDNISYKRIQKAEDDTVHVFYKRKHRKDVIYHTTYKYNNFYAWNYHLIKAEDAKGIISIEKIVNPAELYDINEINPLGLKVFNM